MQNPQNRLTDAQASFVAAAAEEIHRLIHEPDTK